MVTNTGLYGFIQPYGARSLDIPVTAPNCVELFEPHATIAAQRSLGDKKAEMEARRPHLLASSGECGQEAPDCIERSPAVTRAEDWSSKSAMFC